MSKNKTIFDNKVSMNCIDLFSGCGGLTLGLHKTGISGVFAVEKNVDAFKTLKFNMITRCKHFDWQLCNELNNIVQSIYFVAIMKYCAKEAIKSMAKQALETSRQNGWNF